MDTETKKYAATADLIRMRVHEREAVQGIQPITSLQKNFASSYKRLFGIDARRSGQVRRMLEEAAQYGNRDFEEAIYEANDIPDRFPAQPYEPIFDTMNEDAGRNLLVKIEQNKDIALQWEKLQKLAEKTNDTSDWQRAGERAIQYIEKVGIDPSSRVYWVDLYQKFFEWKAKRK